MVLIQKLLVNFKLSNDNALLLKVYGDKTDFNESSTIITINYLNFF